MRCLTAPTRGGLIQKTNQRLKLQFRLCCLPVCVCVCAYFLHACMCFFGVEKSIVSCCCNYRWRSEKSVVSWLKTLLLTQLHTHNYTHTNSVSSLSRPSYNISLFSAASIFFVGIRPLGLKGTTSELRLHNHHDDGPVISFLKRHHPSRTILSRDPWHHLLHFFFSCSHPGTSFPSFSHFSPSE